MINTLLVYINKHRTIFIILIFILAIAIYNVITSATPKQKKVTTTTPIVPTTNQQPQIIISSVLPQQTLNFNWGNLKINIPPSSKEYQITKPLVNKNTITLLSRTLGFSSNDLLKSKISTNRTWENTKGSLFSSINQNQIIYRNKTSSPDKTSTLSKEEAISLSKSILFNYFGNEFVNTLNNDPKVRFLIINDQNYSPTEVSSPETAQYVEISYKQLINSYPLSSLAGNTSILSLVVDNQRNLYRLEISGGFLEISSQGELSLIDFLTLKEIAPNQALKISSLSNTSLESVYISSKKININVNSAYFGYFLTADNGVIPVIYISGTASSNSFSAQPITYVVSANK